MRNPGYWNSDPAKTNPGLSLATMHLAQELLFQLAHMSLSSRGILSTLGLTSDYMQCESGTRPASSPDTRPPVTPLLTTPSMKETWVEVGPGRHWASARNSRNRLAVIHLSRSTKI